MPDPVVEEVIAETAGDDAFDAGFADTIEVVDAPKVEVDPVTGQSPAEVVVVAPKYVQITEEDFASLKGSAAETVSLKEQMAKAFGTIGQMKQVITDLQKATPAGQAVEITDKHFAKLAENFPELADDMRADLAEVLKGMKGTGAPAAAVDPETLQRMVQEKADERELEALDDAHPNWKVIVGFDPASDRANNAFRKWLATEPEEYQARVNNARNASIISRAIDRFTASKTPSRPQARPAPRQEARRAVIADAVLPQGDGGRPAVPAGEGDPFDVGFRTG